MTHGKPFDYDINKGGNNLTVTPSPFLSLYSLSLSMYFSFYLFDLNFYFFYTCFIFAIHKRTKFSFKNKIKKLLNKTQKIVDKCLTLKLPFPVSSKSCTENISIYFLMMFVHLLTNYMFYGLSIILTTMKNREY